VPDQWKDGREHGLLSNTRPEAPNYGKHNPYLYHSDLTWKRQPIAAISLYAMVLPGAPSPTDFANSVAAAKAIPAGLRQSLEGDEALFLIDFDAGRALGTAVDEFQRRHLDVVELGVEVAGAEARHERLGGQVEYDIVGSGWDLPVGDFDDSIALDRDVHSRPCRIVPIEEICAREHGVGHRDLLPRVREESRS
jgi:hypothetical protein